MDSKTKLAQALEAVEDPQLNGMIQKARTGYYSDYESPLVTPCVQLVKDLRRAGQHELAKRAMEGEFDGTRAEAEAWQHSPEGQATFRELLGE